MKFYQEIGTPSDKKEFKEYDASHYLLSDGHVMEDVVENEIEWLNALFL